MFSTGESLVNTQTKNGSEFPPTALELTNLTIFNFIYPALKIRKLITVSWHFVDSDVS